MSDYQGNIVIKNPTPPAGPSTYGRAPGMWKLSEVAYWIKQGVWPDTNVVPDLNFPNVSLLLSTTSLGNANNNLFVDSSGAFNPVIRGGSVATLQGSFSPYSTNWSNYFDASGDYERISSSQTALQFGTGDFTVEGWVYSTGATGTFQQILTGGTSWTSGSGGVYWYYNGGSPYIGAAWNQIATNPAVNSGTLAINTWHHFAVVRSGNTLILYVNGTSVDTLDVTGVSIAVNNQSQTNIGGGGWDQDFGGYLSNLRVVKGTAVYTSNFTVPTSPLTAISGTSLLTCQSNRFRDASTNNFTISVFGNTSVTDYGPFSPSTYAPITYNQSDITNWSGYFDGSGDYLTVPYSTALQFPGDFTVECWVYLNSRVTSFPCIVSNYSSYTSNGGFAIFAGHSNSSTKYQVSFNGSFPVITSSSTVVYGAWTHIALVRSGSTLTLYINGVSEGTASNSATVTGTANNWWIGSSGDSTAASYINGYISNLRAVKGTAVYTSNFTPPTTNLTAISGTSLLTLQNAAFTDNSTNNFVITQFGNVTVNGNNPFQAGYYSNYITPGNYLVTPSNAKFQFGTGDFTVEAWVNLTAYDASYTNVYSSSSNVNGSEGVALIISPSGALRIFSYVSTTYVATGGTVPLNQWVHVAMARQGTTLRLFLNGALSASVTNSENFLGFAEGGGIGGWGSNNGGSFTGYISNVRIVKGTAVYTAAFTPPTSPLTVISGTSLLACAARAYYIDLSNNFSVGIVSAVPPTNAYNPFYTSTTTSSGGSMYFSSTSTGSLETILNVPASNTLDIGAGDFTVECWVYLTATQNYSRIIQFNNTWASAGATPLINANTDTQKLAVSSYDFGVALITADNPYVFNTWYHVAVTRSGNVFSMYINGVKQSGTYTTSSRLWATTTPFMSIGNGPTSVGGFSPMRGYVADVRIIKGSAIYTANFTPPTAPLTPTRNTVLLVNGMNAGIYDATTINDMETVGNAQVSTVQSKFGGSSIYVPSSGGCALIPNSRPMSFGTGNWTVEFWAYTDASGSKVYFDALNAANTVLYMEIYSAGTTIYWVKPGGAVAITGTGALSANTWQHIAACKSGSSTRLFVNGVQVGSTYTDNDTYDTARWEIGGRANLTFPIVGYMDDFRITTGVARYTANFTPPTQAFPTY